MKKLLAIALAFTMAAAPALTSASYGWSSSIGSSLQRDVCPSGDYSASYYDGTCDDDRVSDDTTTGVTLDGYVYFDDNANGTFDSNENGVQGSIVTLKTVSNSIVDTDVTSSGGYYAFYNVAAGTYKIHVSIPSQLTTLETLLAFFAPEVNAQSDYEFTVVVGEDETGTKRVGYTPIVDGEINVDTNTNDDDVSSIDNDDTMNDDDMDDSSDDDIASILDLINDANDDDTPEVTSSVNTVAPTRVLPTALPATGACDC